MLKVTLQPIIVLQYLQLYLPPKTSKQTLTLSNPEAKIRKAEGVWWPLGVAEDAMLLAWRTSSYSDLPWWNSKSCQTQAANFTLDNIPIFNLSLKHFCHKGSLHILLAPKTNASEIKPKLVQVENSRQIIFFCLRCKSTWSMIETSSFNLYCLHGET
jgi:hypothetical protein